VLRVIDFFKSKYQGVELSSIYITGMGCKVTGIDELFSNELNIPTQRMEHLVNVSFPRHFSEGLYNQTEYIAVVGAAMAPVGFKSKNVTNAGSGADALRNAQLIFGLAVIASVAMAGWSFLQYNTAQQKNDELTARKSTLESVNQIFEENEQIKGVKEQVDSIYSDTVTQNELLNSLVSQLEDNLPRTMTVSYLQSDENGINMTLTSKTDISIARLLMNLKAMTIDKTVLEDLEIVSEDNDFPDEIPVLDNITIPSVAAGEGDDGEPEYSFSVTASYYLTAYQEMLQQQQEQQAAAAAAAAESSEE
jgi:hypothetical protein